MGNINKSANTEFIENGYKIKIGRRRTQVTTYENMQLQTTHPIKDTNKKKIKPCIPSNYADFNYHNRIKKRASTLKEIANNSFEYTNVVMITLTYDKNEIESADYTDLEQSHYEFKKFVQRVNTHFDNFRYIATFNRQSNGNWHYHVLCNLSNDITNNQIYKLWKNGITYVTRIKSEADFRQTIDYLISNMKSASSELKRKKGFIYSKNCQKDIIIDSWHDEQASEFIEAFDRVADAKREILYETRNHLGVKGKSVNEDTGEVAEYHIPDRELTPVLQQAGYESWDTIYTHLSSKADFSDKFAPLLPATPKQKKKR